MNKFIVALAVVVTLTPAFAFGALLKAGEEVALTSEESIADNLYTAGGNVSINTPILGDLLVAGGNILITKDVAEDMAVAGGSITILGNSGGDIRVAGGNVLIAGDVAGELVGAGGSVTVSSDVSVGDDLILAGGQVTVEGDVAGDAEVTAGVVTLNGDVAGDVKIIVDDKLSIGEGVVIGGSLEYSARDEAALELGDGAVVTGEVVYNEITAVEKVEAENALVAIVGVFMLFKLLATIVTALVLASLFKRFSQTVVNEVMHNPLRMLGYGFVTLVVVPIAAILLFITLLGIPLGFMTLLAYGLLLMVASVYAVVVAGAWLSKLIRQSDQAVVTWKNVIGGALALAVVKLVPVVGWIIALFIFLVSLGSIVERLRQKMWIER